MAERPWWLKLRCGRDGHPTINAVGRSRHYTLHSTPPHTLALLRPRRERPRGCTAEQRDERPPVHSITSSAMASRDGGTSRPSAFAALKLIAVGPASLEGYGIGCHSPEE